ncbi:MAG: hypothetical protein JW720_02570 [Sedimentisphaerales bacterium]|nr:hypothetical protein [Sedimentisphaerales bacterium]
MIDKINPNLAREIMEKSASMLPDPNRTQQSTQADASLQADFAALIENAGKIADNDRQAVAAAIELIESGALETEQNILKAAQNIVEYGI